MVTRMKSEISALMDGELEAAEFDTALALDEGCVEAHLGLGMASLSAGRFDRLRNQA